MIAQQLWTYIGWVLFTLFVFSIVFLSYALYRDYTITKNKKTSLPSLDVIQAEQRTFFANDDSAANDLAGNTNKIPSRRSLRGAKTGPVASPAVEAKPSAFFDDDEEFTLTSGQD
jgi:hypothetical protein